MRAKRAGKIWNWTAASKHVTIECERSEPEFFKIELKRAEKNWKILQFSPKFYQVKVRLFIFFPEEDKLFISTIFKVRIFTSKKCQPPPPLRIKWSSPNYTKFCESLLKLARGFEVN